MLVQREDRLTMLDSRCRYFSSPIRIKITRATSSSSSKLLTGSSSVIVVDQNGGGNSVSVQGAVDLVPDNNSERVKIFILPGIYREKVFVPKSKPYISFIGSEDKISEQAGRLHIIHIIHMSHFFFNSLV
ncbi:unnamed protein product [Rhodiola kirilowii]